MIATLLLVLAVAVALVVVRARRRATLAGRRADKPTYTIEPPSRRVGSRRRECL